MKKKQNFRRILCACLVLAFSVGMLSGCSGMGILGGYVDKEVESLSKHKKEYDSTDLYETYEDLVGEIVTYDRKGNELSLGTGFQYEEGDQIITNYHVIEGAYSAEITFGDDVYEIVSVLAYDADIDVAVLQIDEERDGSAKVCYDEHDVGLVVYALGNSKGMTSTFSNGMITANTREIDGVQYVQHDAPISSGNSGGPLINSYGEIIGINTWTVRDSQNLNFAIHMSELDNLDFNNQVTLEELYETEFDPYTRLKDYVMEEGNYDDGAYYLTLGEKTHDGNELWWWACYDEGDDYVTLWYTFEGSFTSNVYVDVDQNLSGSYNWGYLDDYDNYMSGTIKAGSFNESTTLSYSQKTLDYGTSATTVQKLASTMMVLLCQTLDDSFSDINVTAVDLGFDNF